MNRMAPKGIALIQVLILSAVLSVVMLSMNFQVREHLKMAQAAEAYADASLQLRSAESEVMFQLLTEEWQKLPELSASKGIAWNFHGRDFQLGTVSVNVQDTSGLMNISAIDRKVLEQLLNNKAAADALVAVLKDWQDPDNRPSDQGAEQDSYPPTIQVRNSGIQFIEELQLIQGMTPELYNQLIPLTSFFTRGINVNQQPDALWRLQYPATQFEELVRQRDQLQLSSSGMERVMGRVIDEFSRFGVGPVFRIRFTAHDSDVKLSREITVRIAPVQPVPVELFELRHQTPLVETSQ
ncbi:general secretion pathway protein GspK [Rheinheimera tilapiae]|jgi:general secretion pathway protein K|uniref:General secretion pathway protein GspK n=1 Tax=Rheinheimera tilapiae TaxID=875043 RepID=A0ABV6BJB1_9GAMM